MDFLKPTFFQKLFNKIQKRNVYIEINNYFAEIDNIANIDVKQIENIEKKYEINIAIKYKKEFTKLYSQYLDFCLKDKMLSKEEIENLKILKNLFKLKTRLIENIHNQKFEEIYKKSVDEILKDGKVTEDEKLFLNVLKENLKIPADKATKIYTEKAKNYLDKKIAKAIYDNKLSPEEEKELNEIANNLNIPLDYGKLSLRDLDRMRLYWVIENGELPSIDIDIKIQKSEQCYFMKKVEWYEYRRSLKRFKYAGPTVRLKIVKGVYWRMGDLATQPVSGDELRKIDEGNAYITNKRLIFTGKKRNKTIKLDKILDFTPYKNGIHISKDTGKSPFLIFHEDIDIFAMILNRAIDEF
ncbi:MAG: hypothetical protein APR54_12125 [Candidatus Cloacimonas sp. SDB]|nr:MAG: hypothetical protein APR54_12125 [Candidatus Cloacimonas sp. SDB]